jgi:hypothetical protein
MSTPVATLTGLMVIAPSAASDDGLCYLNAYAQKQGGSLSGNAIFVVADKSRGFNQAGAVACSTSGRNGSGKWVGKSFGGLDVTVEVTCNEPNAVTNTGTFSGKVTYSDGLVVTIPTQPAQTVNVVS